MLGTGNVTLPSMQAEHAMTLLGVKQQEPDNSCLRCGLSAGCPLCRYFESFGIRCKWFHRDCLGNSASGEPISLFVADNRHH